VAGSTGSNNNCSNFVSYEYLVLDVMMRARTESSDTHRNPINKLKKHFKKLTAGANSIVYKIQESPTSKWKTQCYVVNRKLSLALFLSTLISNSIPQQTHEKESNLFAQGILSYLKILPGIMLLKNSGKEALPRMVPGTMFCNNFSNNCGLPIFLNIHPNVKDNQNNSNYLSQ
jgi:hypothetical protein